jgi:hypothetical protein
MQKRVLRRTKKNKRGGGATSFPSPYFKAGLIQPDASAGSDILQATPYMARPRIGGKRRKTSRSGGFVPSVMGPFTESAAKYITPIALYAGYKFLTRKQTKGKKTRRSQRR